MNGGYTRKSAPSRKQQNKKQNGAEVRLGNDLELAGSEGLVV